VYAIAICYAAAGIDRRRGMDCVVAGVASDSNRANCHRRGRDIRENRGLRRAKTWQSYRGMGCDADRHRPRPRREIFAVMGGRVLCCFGMAEV